VTDAPRKKILIIEDDEAARELFRHYLQTEGHEVSVAADGKKGLESARALRPDLVVLDLMLPELHGIGVCQALKADPSTRHAKVLIASVKGFPADRKQAAEAGADDFLAKPVNRGDFTAAVKRLLT
jgi:DNA-binding response OmpR family regulator